MNTITRAVKAVGAVLGIPVAIVLFCCLTAVVTFGLGWLVLLLVSPLLPSRM